MALLNAQDEFGQRWIVYQDDPGWPHTHALALRGVKEIVLPRQALLTGHLTAHAIPRTMAQWDITNPTLAALLRRYVRLQDCLEALNGTT